MYHNMTHIMKPQIPVGIVGYGAYIPRYRIRDSEIGRVWHDGAKGLIKEKSVPGLDEDTITMSIEACRNALKRAQIDPQELRAVWIGSESHPYAVKPSGTIVSEAIGAGPGLSAADTEFACKAGTEALTMAMGLVSSGMGKYALACGMDTAQGRPGDVLEYTAGAGGAAVIIGPAEESAAGLEGLLFPSLLQNLRRVFGHLHPVVHGVLLHVTVRFRFSQAFFLYQHHLRPVHNILAFPGPPGQAHPVQL